MGSKLVNMTKTDYIEYIKLQLTGGVIDLEVSDENIGKQVDAALQELQRFIDQPAYVTIPFASCISLEGFDCKAITGVYRTEGYTGDGGSEIGDGSFVDPMYAQTWMVFSSGGSYFNLKNYVYNYLAYNTLIQMRNTTSTELDWYQDKTGDRIYINKNYDVPKFITLQYIPIYKNVEEITSPYWIDMLKKLSLAMTKQILGRVRTRFTQTNALWTQDGETMLSEANEELKEIREHLKVNTNMFIVKD